MPYAFAAAAQLMLMFREPEKFSGRRLAVDATVAILAFLYSFWMIYGAGQEYIAQGFLLLMAGIPVYVYIKWRQSKAVEPDRRRSPSRRAHEAADDRPLVKAVGSDAMSTPTPSSVAAREAAAASTFGVHSEVGVLHTVLVHRPGLELERLTPRNKDDLLFDDVIWVKRARQEHDAFVDALAERGVEVLEVTAPARARRSIRPLRAPRCSTARSSRRGSARASAPRSRVARRAAPRPSSPNGSSAESRTTSCRSRRPSLSALARRGDFVLAPLPNQLFTRDTSAWVYGGVCVNHMAKPRPRARGRPPRRDLPPPPALRRTASSRTGARDARTTRRSRAATCS